MATLHKHTLAHRGEVGDLRSAATIAAVGTKGGLPSGQREAEDSIGSRNSIQSSGEVKNKTGGRRLIVACDGKPLSSFSSHISISGAGLRGRLDGLRPVTWYYKFMANVHPGTWLVYNPPTTCAASVLGLLQIRVAVTNKYFRIVTALP
jgi:hypothetical protein